MSVCAQAGRDHMDLWSRSWLRWTSSRLLCAYLRTFQAKLLCPSTRGTSRRMRLTILSLCACELRLGAIRKCWYASVAAIASRQMALTRSKANIQELRHGLWAAPVPPFLALRELLLLFFVLPTPAPPAAAVAGVVSEVGDLVSRAMPAISLPTTMPPPVNALPKTLDFCMLAISPPESLLEIEFWRERVRRMFECSVTSGSPPKPVVCKHKKRRTAQKVSLLLLYVTWQSSLPNCTPLSSSPLPAATHKLLH